MTVLAPGGGAAAPPGCLAAVECDQITYTFGSHTAVGQLDLRIEPGETFGLLGPNGAGRLFDVPRKQWAGRVDGALAAMGLQDAASRRARTYSGGMVRRLELAQALVNAPRLLVLDEPTVGLDPIARTLEEDEAGKGGIRNVRRARSTARRLG